MLRHIRPILAGIVIGVGLTGLALSSGAASSGGLEQVALPAQFDQEPLIVYDVSGFGLAGPIHRRLSLYSNGLATVSRAFGFGAPTEGSSPTTTGESAFKWVSPQRARTTWKKTIRAGGLTAQDGGFIGADIPLTTITIFGTPGRTSNTFNFFFVTGDAAVVNTIINDFIAEEFPGF